MDSLAFNRTGAPSIAGTGVAFTPYRYNQDEVTRELTKVGGPEFMRFARTSGVDHRNLALPVSRYPQMSGFTEANAAYIEVACDLGRQAVLSALDSANIAPDEVDVIVMVSSTGIAVPTIDARIAIEHRPAARREAGAAVRAWLRCGCGRDGPRARLPAWLPRPRGGIAVG